MNGSAVPPVPSCLRRSLPVSFELWPRSPHEASSPHSSNFRILSFRVRFSRERLQILHVVSILSLGCDLEMLEAVPTFLQPIRVCYLFTDTCITFASLSAPLPHHLHLIVFGKVLLRSYRIVSNVDHEFGSQTLRIVPRVRFGV